MTNYGAPALLRGDRAISGKSGGEAGASLEAKAETPMKRPQPDTQAVPQTSSQDEDLEELWNIIATASDKTEAVLAIADFEERLTKQAAGSKRRVSWSEPLAKHQRHEKSIPVEPRRPHPEKYQITYPQGLAITPMKLSQTWQSHPPGPRQVVFFFDRATTSPTYLYRLSNWFVSPPFDFTIPELCGQAWIQENDLPLQVQITCGEQALMLCKAALMRDAITFQRILAAESPRAIKALGRQVTPFDEERWLRWVCAISLAVVRGRIQRDRVLRDMVAALSGSYIAEASPTDRLHGIGMRANDPDARHPSRWQGANVLGWAYMTVSKELAGQDRRKSTDSGESPGVVAVPRPGWASALTPQQAAEKLIQLTDDAKQGDEVAASHLASRGPTLRLIGGQLRTAAAASRSPSECTAQHLRGAGVDVPLSAMVQISLVSQCVMQTMAFCVMVSTLLEPLVLGHADGDTVVGFPMQTDEVPAKKGKVARLFEQATDIVSQTFSQCDFPLVPAGRYRDCAPVVVAPLRVSPPTHLIARTPRQRMHKAKSGAAFIFMTFAALAGTPSYELTASALARVNSFVRPAQDIREATLAGAVLADAVRFTFGGLPVHSLIRDTASTVQHVPGDKRTMCEQAREYERLLQLDLLNEPGEGDIPDYIRALAGSVRFVDCEQLPEELFTDGAEYEQAGLDDLPFSHDCPVPVTDFVHRLPKQPDRCDSCAQSVHRCDQFIRPVPACQGLVAQWWANATADFQVLSRGERLEGRRKTRTIALGQSCFVPCARDCWFDCRQQKRGVITALDYHQHIDSQLDRDFIAPEMKGWPDQELASFIAFGAITTPQMPHMLVLSPQLLSLADGYLKGQEELVTLATKNWYDFFDWVPFFPGHTCPKGSTCRELEERPRPTTNGTHPPCESDGSPRVYDSDGTGVYSPNYRARQELKTRSADTVQGNDLPQCVECEQHGADTCVDCERTEVDAVILDVWKPFSHRVPATSRPPPADWRTRTSAKWSASWWEGYATWDYYDYIKAPEFKPSVRSMLRDAAIYKKLGTCLGLPRLIGTADYSNAFMHIRTRPEAYPRSMTITASHPLIDEQNPLKLQFVAEYVLGFGHTHSSGTFQRWASFLLHLTMKRFDLLQREYVQHLEQTSACFREWLRRRRVVARRTRRVETRLCSRFVYSDDPSSVCVGNPSFINLHKAARWVDQRVRMIPSIIEKIKLGTHVKWLGAMFNAHLGFLTVPQDKLIKAQTLIRSALDGQLPVAEYRKLMGFLEWFAWCFSHARSRMWGLYRPLRAGQELDQGPATLVYMNERMTEQLMRWSQEMYTVGGVSLLSAVPKRKHVWPAATPTFFVSMDAAKEGTDTPGIAGWCHGRTWALFYHESWLQLPIAVLEFLAFAVSLIVFYPFLREAPRVVFDTDSISAAFDLSKEDAKSPVMQEAYGLLITTHAWEQLIHHAEDHERSVRHVNGALNVFADGESRGYGEHVKRLCTHFGIRRQPLPLPEEAITYLNEFLRRISHYFSLPLVALHSTAMGMHNPHMAPSPFAQSVPRQTPRGITPRRMCKCSYNDCYVSRQAGCGWCSFCGPTGDTCQSNHKCWCRCVQADFACLGTNWVFDLNRSDTEDSDTDDYSKESCSVNADANGCTSLRMRGSGPQEPAPFSMPEVLEIVIGWLGEEQRDLGGGVAQHDCAQRAFIWCAAVNKAFYAAHVAGGSLIIRLPMGSVHEGLFCNQMCLLQLRRLTVGRHVHQVEPLIRLVGSYAMYYASRDERFNASYTWTGHMRLPYSRVWPVRSVQESFFLCPANEPAVLSTFFSYHWFMSIFGTQFARDDFCETTVVMRLLRRHTPSIVCHGHPSILHGREMKTVVIPDEARQAILQLIAAAKQDTISVPVWIMWKQGDILRFQSDILRGLGDAPPEDVPIIFTAQAMVTLCYNARGSLASRVIIGHAQLTCIHIHMQESHHPCAVVRKVMLRLRGKGPHTSQGGIVQSRLPRPSELAILHVMIQRQESELAWYNSRRETQRLAQAVGHIQRRWRIYRCATQHLAQAVIHIQRQWRIYRRWALATVMCTGLAHHLLRNQQRLQEAFRLLVRGSFRATRLSVSRRKLLMHAFARIKILWSAKTETMNGTGLHDTAAAGIRLRGGVHSLAGMLSQDTLPTTPAALVQAQPGLPTRQSTDRLELPELRHSSATCNLRSPMADAAQQMPLQRSPAGQQDAGASALISHMAHVRQAEDYKLSGNQVAFGDGQHVHNPALHYAPDDPRRIAPPQHVWEDYLHARKQALEASVPQGTRNSNDTHWNFWKKHCARWGCLTPLRDDIEAMSGRDQQKFRQEMHLAASYVLARYQSMESRAKGGFPKPESAFQSYLAVVRIMGLRGVPKLPMHELRRQVHGLNVQHIAEHGLESLLPNRKQPHSNETQRKLLDLPDNTKLGPFVYARDNAFGRTWRLLLHILDATGFRKAEWAVSSRAGTTHMTCKQIAWLLPGDEVPVRRPSKEQLAAALASGQDVWVLLYPVPSKCDPDGSKFCTKPVPFKHNAANPSEIVLLLAELENELWDAHLSDMQRAERPLFADMQGRPLLRSAMDSALHAALSLVVPPAVAKHISWHSWRIRLATKLRAANKDDQTIQACVRWVTDKAVKIYGRFEHNFYWTLLQEAKAQDTLSFQISALPEIDESKRVLAMLQLDHISDQQQLESELNKLMKSPAIAPHAEPRMVTPRPLPPRPAEGDGRHNIISAERCFALPPGYRRVQMNGRHFHVLDPQGVRLHPKDTCAVAWRHYERHRTDSGRVPRPIADASPLPHAQVMAEVPATDSGNAAPTPPAPSRREGAYYELTPGGCGTLGCTLRDGHLGPCSSCLIPASRRRGGRPPLDLPASPPRSLSPTERFVGRRRRQTQEGDGPGACVICLGDEPTIFVIKCCSARFHSSCLQRHIQEVAYTQPDSSDDEAVYRGAVRCPACNRRLASTSARRLLIQAQFTEEEVQAEVSQGTLVAHTDMELPSAVSHGIIVPQSSEGIFTNVVQNLFQHLWQHLQFSFGTQEYVGVILTYLNMCATSSAIRNTVMQINSAVIQIPLCANQYASDPYANAAEPIFEYLDFLLRPCPAMPGIWKWGGRATLSQLSVEVLHSCLLTGYTRGFMHVLLDHARCVFIQLLTDIRFIDQHVTFVKALLGCEVEGHWKRAPDYLCLANFNTISFEREDHWLLSRRVQYNDPRPLEMRVIMSCPDFGDGQVPSLMGMLSGMQFIINLQVAVMEDTNMFTMSNPCLLHIVAQMRFVPSMFVGTAPITPMLARKHREQYCDAWREASAADVAAESPPVTLPYPPAHGLSAANFPFH